jgi:pilus assembly protein CpaB
MKKSALIIYIAMIVVGLIGLFIYTNKSGTPPPQSVTQPVAEARTETISVAVANHNLEVNSVIKAEDYQIKRISVPEGSADKRFDVSGKVLIDWALKQPVAAEDWIFNGDLVEPGSDEYLAMFLKPGNVVYTFELDAADNYLLSNLKAGNAIDIYLSYSLKTEDDGSTTLISPPHAIRESRLKPLMRNKRILSIRRAKIVDKNGVEVVEKGSQLVVELKDYDVKMLKGLEGKSKVVLFPSEKGTPTEPGSAAVSADESWLISDDAIFKIPPHKLMTAEVNELRGQ